MQSATSFFNRALFRKNLQRFWPLWLGYVLIWLLLLPLPLLNGLADYHGVPTVADASYYLLQIGAYGEDDGELTSAQANTLVSALRRDYEAGHASNASLFEDTLYSGSFYVELELWYSIRVDEKPTRQPIDTTSNSSGSVCAIVTPEMTCTLEALAGMGIETPAAARGF